MVLDKRKDPILPILGARGHCTEVWFAFDKLYLDTLNTSSVRNILIYILTLHLYISLRPRDLTAMIEVRTEMATVEAA